MPEALITSIMPDALCQEVSRHDFPLFHRNPLPVFDDKHVPNVTWEKCASKLEGTKLLLSRTSILPWWYQEVSRHDFPLLHRNGSAPLCEYGQLLLKCPKSEKSPTGDTVG